MKKLSCNDAKQIDLVDYLASLGHHPQKVRNQDYWYLSPLRQEKTASFKINRQKNVWFDHGTGKGGDLIDFGTAYNNCSIKDLLEGLSGFLGRPGLDNSFNPPIESGFPVKADPGFAGEKEESSRNKIVIVDTRSLSAITLLNYLKKRCIPLAIATRFCREVDFLLYEKVHTAIGFQNNSGGYELRNENFKGSSAPKDITFIDNQKDQVSVFEGYFNFLSYQCLFQQNPNPLTNFLILNSLAFLKKSKDLMEQHQVVDLYFDRDHRGLEATQDILQSNKEKYRDRSNLYQTFKDLNEWHQHTTLRQKRNGRSLHR